MGYFEIDRNITDMDEQSKGNNSKLFYQGSYSSMPFTKINQCDILCFNPLTSLSKE